jgi:hypothetical protein
MTPAAAKSKIAKLLRLGRSPNQHEAELAMKMAMEIATKYRLSLQPGPDAPGQADVEAIFFKRDSLTFEEKQAAYIVGKYFGCWVTLGDGKLLFSGLKGSPAIGVHIFEVLVRLVRSHLKSLASLGTVPAAIHDGFIMGFFHGVDLKLAESQLAAEHGTQLVLSGQMARIKAWLDEEFNVHAPPEEKITVDPLAWHAGRTNGRAVRISRPTADRAKSPEPV